MYRSNALGIKTKLDAVGNEIDGVWEGTKDIASSAGEAVSNTVSAMIPKIGRGDDNQYCRACI